MRRPVLAVLGLFAAVFLVCGVAQTALAFFDNTGRGTGTASVTTLGTPTITSLTTTGSSVTVKWTAVTPPGGTLDGYLVTKSVGTATFPACGTNLNVPPNYIPAGTLTCTDTLVPNGTYRYTVTAIFRSWTGASTPSASITVAGDVTAPLQTIALGTNPGTAYLTGTTLFLRTAVASAITLAASVTDNGVGPASATFPAITTPGFTHAAETVTNGVGTNPTKTYTSSPISWTAGATAPTSYAVTGKDLVNNAATTTLTVYTDNAAPTGGALTVNGVAATTTGTVSQARTAFTIGLRTNYVDAATAPSPASGLVSSNLVVDSTPFVNNTCGTTYSNPTIIGGTANITLTSGYCYRYTLTGIDNVGNTSSVTTTVKYDSAAPTNVVSASNLTNAYFTANRVYVRTGVAGSFKLTTAVTDTASGPASVTYPAVTTVGWTHAAETVTTGTGTAPTLSYASSTYSWTAGAGNARSTTISSQDRFTNTTNTAIAITRDNTAPRSGSLVVNGISATSGGSSSYARVTSLTPTGTNYVDTGSGLASSILTYSVAPLTNGVCGTYNSPTTITFATAVATLTSNCYKFTLTGTDNVGNVSSLTTTVINDVDLPSGGGFTVNGTPASASTPVISTTANSVNITNQVNFTDAQSGLATGSNVLTTATASLSNNVCGGFGNNGNLTTTGLNSGCYKYTLTATDLAGNVSTTSIIVKVDVNAPTGGALIVNGGQASTTGNVTTYSRTGTVAITSRTDYTDTNSGLASSVVMIGRAPLTNNACGTYSSYATVLSGLSTQTFSTSGCYLYSLVGTDNAGNVSTISTTVKVDLLAPVNGALSVNGTAASAAGTTSSANSAFTITRTDWTDNETSATSTLTVASTTYTGGTCGTTYGGTTTLTGAPTQTGLAAGCYKYTLTGTDTAGNTSSISTIVRYDATAPTGGALSVNGVAATTAGSTSTSNAASFTITRTDFADANSGLASSTLTVANAALNGTTCGTFGAATVLTGAPTQSNLATGCYRYVLTGTDLAGNSTSLTTTVTMGARVTNIQLINKSGTAGRIDQGDQIVVTFSDQMSVSSLCSTWTGDTTNQLINGNNQVTATLNNGGPTDTLTVSSSVCTLRFGTLNLGSNAYTSANVNFGGIGAAATTLAWNASTHQLTLTLGAASGAGAATVPSSIVTYTPATGVTTSAGVAVGGTFVTANQPWF